MVAPPPAIARADVQLDRQIFLSFFFAPPCLRSPPAQYLNNQMDVLYSNNRMEFNYLNNGMAVRHLFHYLNNEMEVPPFHYLNNGMEVRHLFLYLNNEMESQWRFAICSDPSWLDNDAVASCNSRRLCGTGGFCPEVNYCGHQSRQRRPPAS